MTQAEERPGTVWSDLLTAMPPDLRAEMLSHAVRRTLARNETLFGQGSASEALYVIERGRVAVSVTSNGRETVLAVLEAGRIFGELGLFHGASRSAAVRALSDTVLLEVDYVPVRAAIAARPEVLWTVTGVLAQRLRDTNEALIDTMFLDVGARTAKRLLELGGGADSFRLPVTQEELAAMVGASRERVNKAIAQFTRRGWLRTEGRGRYRVLDREALEQRALLVDDPPDGSAAQV